MKDMEYAADLQYAAQNAPEGERFALDSCADTMICELDAIDLESRGRIVELTVRLHNVCPGKRTALGVLLHEVDESGSEEPRGMKTLTVPAHSEARACDILVRHIYFVLPEDLSLSTDGVQRRFVARTTAHYVDVDAGCLCPAHRRGRD